MTGTVHDLFDDWDLKFSELCAAYDKPYTNERRAAYRKGMQKLHSAAWLRLLEHCISEAGPEKFPTVRDLWAIHRKLRSWTARAPKANTEEWRGSHSLRVVNLMFYRWMVAQMPLRVASKDNAGKPRSIPDAELAARRRACISLAETEEIMRADGQASLEHLQESFNVAMARIPAKNCA